MRSWRARARTEILARMRCLQSDESTHSHLQGHHLSRAGLVILQEGKRWRGRRPFCAIAAPRGHHCRGRGESKDGEPLPMSETASEHVSTLVQVSLVVSTEPVRTDWWQRQHRSRSLGRSSERGGKLIHRVETTPMGRNLPCPPCSPGGAFLLTLTIRYK